MHSTLPTHLTLPWSVRSVQRDSDCTIVHFNFKCTSYPLWALRTVKSLSYCTKVYINFTYNFTPPMGCMTCTEPQCLYKCAHYLTNTSLLLWTVEPVQILSARTTVHFNFTYTSTPPMGRTACTESQCLYRGALYRTFYIELQLCLLFFMGVKLGLSH